ncbi:MAG: aminopeptidase P family protein, partial [Rhodobacteraceae bacterium]|nr:aminopeptidase P family protein [Paracoccaceae bacterium]
AQAGGADFGSVGFTARTRDRLAALRPDVRFVAMPGSADLLRSVKDTLEVGRIEQASGIADGAMAAITRAVRAGMRPRDASAIAARHYLTRGADDYWVGPISVSRRAEAQGHDMGFLHAVLRDDTLADGDVLHVELVPRVGGYSARMMRSIRLGAPSEEEVATMARIRALQDAQIAAMVPGACAREVDALLRQPMLDEGLRAGFPNITGYQLGLYAKTPRSSDTSLSFHPGADWRLQAGQVFHMYATARGLALSETVLVTPSGGRALTRTPRRIMTAGETVTPAGA